MVVGRAKAFLLLGAACLTPESDPSCTRRWQLLAIWEYIAMRGVGNAEIVDLRSRELGDYFFFSQPCSPGSVAARLLSRSTLETATPIGYYGNSFSVSIYIFDSGGRHIENSLILYVILAMYPSTWHVETPEYTPPLCTPSTHNA